MVAQNEEWEAVTVSDNGTVFLVAKNIHKTSNGTFLVKVMLDMQHLKGFKTDYIQSKEGTIYIVYEQEISPNLELIRTLSSSELDNNKQIIKTKDYETSSLTSNGPGSWYTFDIQSDTYGKCNRRLKNWIENDQFIIIDIKKNSVKKSSSKKNDKLAKLFLSNMVFVEGDSFVMGSTKDKHTQPVHREHVKSFYLGKHEVTQHEWEMVMGNNPAWIKATNRPITNISWDDVQKFIQKINELTGLNFRLPTEAEWEFAAEGGKTKCRFKQNQGLSDVAWGRGNSHGLHDVETRQPNPLGLYDMLGNVYEYIGEDWREDYRSEYNPDWTVARGGCWDSFQEYCSPTTRYKCGKGAKGNTLGFRLAIDDIN